ncbi:RHS repeat-associated core domain-containing protein [Actinoplanes sp. NPDC048791]|uniref:RHS repeat-associated core domain-containing protein n=1 Tax=Actinoplanes sp. NPDC048791 TaxID=3154623 RepID=UPI0033DA0155
MSRTTKSPGVPARSRQRRSIAGPLVLIMAATIATQTLPDTADAATVRTPEGQDVKGVNVHPVVAARKPAWTASAREVTATKTPDKRAFAGEQVVELRDGASGKGARAGTLPVYVRSGAARSSGARSAVAPVAKVKVTLQDGRADNVDGLLLKVARADGVAAAGTADVTVDYRQLSGRFSPDALSRLRLFNAADGRSVASRNDARAGTVSGAVSLAAAGATTLALAAAAEGDNGDYKATSLSAASTWQVSQQTGAFTWSYPVKVPPAVGSFAPSVALSYNSGAIDGRTAGTNTQGSWVGDGWDLWPGYVERSYRACSDDHDTKEKKDPNNADERGGDLCYFDDNATLSFNGGAVGLVKVTSTDTAPGDGRVQYRGSTDDGSKIEMIRDKRSNGDVDGTYWRQTTTDGTQYFYGRSAASTFTVPVYSNHPDDPGYDKTFAESRHSRAWRWNLDHAIDVNGNTITYTYANEVGAYAREDDEDKRTTYDRGGYLTRIEYGSRDDDLAGTHPVARVDFTTADRCKGTCFGDDKKPNPSAFPDTPWDQYCDEAPCKTQRSPTFWTAKRLSDITTKVYSGTGDDYTPVDTWHLEHTYLSAGGNEGSPMWLKSVQHKGLSTSAGGTVVTDPPTVFDPNADLMANRVDGPQDGHSSLYRSRINTITTESGAQIGVTYSAPDCTRSTLPKPWANTSRCFPQYYGAEGETPKLDWFHKYVVTRLDVYDNTGGFDHEQSNYKYLDTPAWAYDDSPLTKPKKRTWGDYRGYGRVEVRQGLEDGVQSATEYRYFRGMDGDQQPDDKGDLPPTGTPRNVDVEDSLGNKIADHESFSGILRETIVKNGVGGTWVSGTLNTPGHLEATATVGSLHAWPVNTKTTRTRTRLADGTTRWTTSDTVYDDDNYPTQINVLGDDATAADDKCTTMEYVRNRDANILGAIKRTSTVAVKCGATSTSADVLSDTRTWYDNAEVYGKEPIRGLPVRVDDLDSWSGTTPQFVTVSTTGYDAEGRTTSVTDILKRRIRTVFTPEHGGPVRQTAVTDPMNDTVTTVLDPARGVALTKTDANNATTSMTYDGSGRLLATWSPGHAQASYPNAPNARFTYQLRSDAPSAVTTEVLTGYAGTVYRKSIALFDGLLRARQTQTQTVNGGRALSDTIYNSRGLIETATVPYYDPTNAAPQTKLVTPDGRPEVPAQTTNLYDGAGRLTDAIFMKSQSEVWRTHTSYAGEKTSVTPPQGATATTTITDAAGRIVELRQYKDPKNVGSDTTSAFDKATYTYNRQGLRSKVVDHRANNTWSYEYDLRGRVTLVKDPDNGETRSTYYADGQLKTVQTAERTLAYTYDDRGRTTSQRQNAIDGPKIAEWFYDTLEHGKGLPAKAVRYEPPGSANEYVTAVAGYDEAGRTTGTTVTVPPSETGLCVGDAPTPCSYTVSQTYRSNGDVWRTKFPAVAKLPRESVETSYNKIGLVDGAMGILDAGNELYAEDDFNQLGQLIKQTLGLDINKVTLVTGIDEQTGRRTSFQATPLGKPDVYRLSYDYDNAGNVLNITDKPDGGQAAETQCFGYDYLRRITEAWTPKSMECKSAPTLAGLDGPAKYWHSYTFDTAGNRQTEKIHGVTDATRTYTYPASGAGAGTKPHAVTKVVTTSGTTNTVTRTENYRYDKVGNTICRPAGATDNICPGETTAAKEHQVLSWTDDGKIAKSTDKTGDTTYIYDADGNRLIRKDPTGATLYLPGGTEVRKPKTSEATGTRYYSDNGTTVAVRTPAGLTWMVNDHHGTGSATVSNDGKQTVNRQRTLPYGTNRGANPTAWVGDKGFVGGIKDNTGLTHLGAREYDPALGRFISVDPLMDLADPAQWDGYVYANNNPITASDPTGMICTMALGGKCTGPGDSVPETKGGGSGGSGSGKGNGGGGSGGSGGTGSSGGSGSGGTGNTSGGGSGPPPGCGSANACETHAISDGKAIRLAVIAAAADGRTNVGGACALRIDLCKGFIDDVKKPDSDYMFLSVQFVCLGNEACMAERGYESPMAPHLGSALNPIVGDTLVTLLLPVGAGVKAADVGAEIVGRSRGVLEGGAGLNGFAAKRPPTTSARVAEQTLGPAKPSAGVSATRGDKVLEHEKEMVNGSGDVHGCSTCPATKSGYADGHWTPDHQPPYSLVPDGPWTLYPQCRACTKQQGGIVNGIGRGWYDFK